MAYISTTTTTTTTTTVFTANTNINITTTITNINITHSSINSSWVNEHHHTTKLQKSDICCLQRGGMDKLTKVE